MAKHPNAAPPPCPGCGRHDRYDQVVPWGEKVPQLYCRRCGRFAFPLPNPLVAGKTKEDGSCG